MFVIDVSVDVEWDVSRILKIANLELWIDGLNTFLDIALVLGKCMLQNWRMKKEIMCEKYVSTLIDYIEGKTLRRHLVNFNIGR